MKDFNKLIAFDSRNSRAYFNRAVVKSHLQDLRGAVSDLDICIKIDSNDIKAYISRGDLRDVLTDYQGALTDYHKAAEIDWKHYYSDGAVVVGGENQYKASIYESSAIVKEKLQDYKGAIEDYTMAMAMEPKWGRSGIYYLYRGFARIKYGEKDSGCLDLSKAGELGIKRSYDSIKKYCN